MPSGLFEDVLLESDVGPQNDGTYTIPDTGVQTFPVDAGGGVAGTYGSTVLDIFKFGVGAIANDRSRKDFLDYKRFEAQQSGLYQQGKPAAMGAARQGGGVSGTVILVALGIVAVIVLTHKG